jgi:hypothetical protein
VENRFAWRSDRPYTVIPSYSAVLNDCIT